MRVYRILTAVVVLSVSSGAFAADWWLVEISGNKPKRSLILFDKSSEQHSTGSRVKAWKQGYYEDSSDGILTDKIQFEFDCSGRTIKSLSWINYGRDGSVVGSSTPSQYIQRDEPIAPDTVGESELDFVCGSKTSAIQIGMIPDLGKAGGEFIRLLDAPRKVN